MVNAAVTILYGLSALAVVADARPLLQDTKSQCTSYDEPRALDNTASAFSLVNHASQDALRTEGFKRDDLEVGNEAVLEQSLNDSSSSGPSDSSSDNDTDSPSSSSSSSFAPDVSSSESSLSAPAQPKEKKKWYTSKTFLGPAIGVPVAAALSWTAWPSTPKAPGFVPKLGSAFGKRDDDVGEVFVSGPRGDGVAGKK